MTRITVLLLVVALAGISSAQCATLNSILNGTDGQNGTMFNIVNISAAPITVSSFDQTFLAVGSGTMEIYTKAGTYFGFESTPGAWTFVGGGAVSHPLAFTPYPIPIGVNVAIGPGRDPGLLHHRLDP